MDISYGPNIHSGEMTFSSESMGLAAARRQIISLAVDLQLSNDEADDLLLAVGEAVTNAYVHGTPYPGRGLVYLGWHCEGDTLTVTVKDQGPGNSSTRRTALREQNVETLGKGIAIMRSVMDEVEIHFEQGATVTLRKQRLRVRNQGVRLG